MSNSGWKADPAYLLVPPSATDSEPRIFIGGNQDPTLLALGQTEGIVFYFGEQRAFLISVEQIGPPGSPADTGRLHIWAFCGFPAQLHQVVNLDYDIPTNDVSWQFNSDSPDATMSSTLSLKADVVGLGGSTEPASTDPAFQDVYLFGDSMARGAKAFGSATASSAAIAAEAVVLTTGSFTFRAGRSYKAELHGMINAGTAGARATFRLRKGTTTAGTGLSFTGDVACAAVGPNYNGDGFVYFQVNATDVTTQMCFTLVGTGGTITQFGSANTPRYMTIYDVGESADFPNAPVLS
jgi:hypothetical protein